VQISKERLDEFKRIYKKQFKNDISDSEALEKATKLIRLIEIIYKPMTEGEYRQLRKRREETEDLSNKKCGQIP
jgi:hypothetical protein